VVRNRYDEDVASTWHSTNTTIISNGVGLRRNDLTLWKRHVAFTSNGDYEMFSVQAGINREQKVREEIVREVGVG
jgi:hypothetical protein